MKRVKWERWLVAAMIGLPFVLVAVSVQVARRAADARRHQHELNVALFHAAQTNAVPQVESLLAKGAEATALEYYEEPDVSLPALWRQWWDRFHGAPVPAEGASHGAWSSAYHEALDNAAQSHFKDWRVLKLLADHGANVNERAFGSDQTALDWTTELQNWDATNYLLDKGANPSLTGMSNSNPFLQTVACDNLPVVKKMLDRGANVNFVPAGYGDTILGCAVIHENPAMIRLLLVHGANINLPTSEGATPLHRCQGNEKEVEIATLLLDLGANPNVQNKEGNTSLMAAAAGGDLELARLFLAHRTDPSIRNRKGQTALQLAQSQHHADIAALLDRASAKR